MFTVLLLAATVSAAGAGAARADGRLASYPLVYRLTPATTEDPLVEYVVFFRTRGSFIGHDDVGTSIPGELSLEDSSDNHDGLGVLSATRHCYIWSLGGTDRLGAKHIGDRVRLRFALRRTRPQVRNVTLRRAPSRAVRNGKPWYRNGSVAKHLRNIGCGAG
jgi:hypothetical protein